MADFNTTEVLNEVSKLFRAGLDAGKEGGNLNTRAEYAQLLELISTTLLLNNDAIFYLALLASNQLSNVVVQEVAILEDILVLLDDLGQVGSPVRDTATLSNARTSILSLDAASSLTGRPESDRFTRQMDIFAEQVKGNVVSESRGNILVRPREDARNILEVNLGRLTSLHYRLLAAIIPLRDLLDDYLVLDIPSRVSSTVLSVVNTRLQDTITTLESDTDTENLEFQRRLFLETLANKVGVKILANFSDPRELKFRSPLRPIPSTLAHLGQVTGSGVPASILTSPGPWDLPMTAPLDVAINGGGVQSLAIDAIKGATLNGRSHESFVVSADAKNIHVIVDPNTYTQPILLSTTTSVDLTGKTVLGFKHLGALVSFPETSLIISVNDAKPRVISEMNLLQTYTSLVFTAPDIVDLVGLAVVEDDAAALTSLHVGAYLKDSTGQRFEIISVNSSTQAVIDPRALTPTTGAGELRGQDTSVGATLTKFSILPAMGTAPTGNAVFGPVLKTAGIAVGTKTVVAIIADIQAETGDFDVGHIGIPLNQHVEALAVPEDPTRLALRIRSKLSPFIQIAGRMIHPDLTALSSPTIPTESLHPVLGFREGESDTTDLLTPAELVSAILDPVSGIAGADAEVVTTALTEGVSLSTVLSSKDVVDPSVDFEALGILVRDQVALQLAGSSLVVRISAVSGSTLTLELEDTFASVETNLDYSVFREQVKISSASAGVNSSVLINSAPAELSLTVGTTIYSAIPNFEAVDKFGSKLNFTGAVAGDFLRIVGSQVEFVVSENQGELLVLETGLPSNTSGIGFEISSAAARSFESLNSRLTTFISSRNLLAKNNFDTDVTAILNSVTAAILPGQNFVSSRNQAKRFTADLLSILTSNPLRSDEYSASLPTAADTLLELLADYVVPIVEPVDNVIDALRDRKYDRAADLLRGGRVTEFYATDQETASFSGAVMSSSRGVIRDLPQPARTMFEFRKERDLANSVFTGFDAESDFSDSEDAPDESDA